MTRPALPGRGEDVFTRLGQGVAERAAERGPARRTVREMCGLAPARTG
ncbi:hypothetical protein ACVV2G_22415 [Streptomyces ziwulingensis]